MSAPGSLARALDAAMDHYRSLRAGGVPFLDACEALEVDVRVAFPVREEPEPLTCTACRDTGFEPHEVWMRTYQAYGREVRFCQCDKGRAMRERYENRQAQKAIPAARPRWDDHRNG